MKWLQVERWVILLASLAAAAFALWNLIDEIRPSWDYLVIFECWGAWCLFPCVNALIGCRAKRPGLVRTSTVLALLYAYFYSHYAFNGSTRGKTGAEHMHLDLVPILSAFLFVSVHALGLIMPPLRRMINRPFQSS